MLTNEKIFEVLVKYWILLEVIRRYKKLLEFIINCYFEAEFEGYIYYIILEVDLTHFTSMSKFQLYEKMYRDRELKDQCLTFPQIVVMGVNSVRYESKQLEIVYLPFSLEGFEEVLSIEESAITD